MWPVELSLVMALGSALVIAAGHRLVTLADEFADRTGIDKALVGMA